jgi:hypothetical protein
VPLVLPAEVRGVIVTDSVAGLRRVEILAESRLGVLPGEYGKTRLWLRRSLRRFEYGNGQAEIGGCSANATA